MFDPRPDAPDFIVFRSPAAPFSVHRVNAKKRVFKRRASRRSRKLGTAFRSPVTTLSPPLRGQCSWPAPSNPRTGIAPIRSTEDSPLGAVSKPQPGRIHHPRPVIHALLARSCDAPPSPLPFGPFRPSGLKRSTGLIAGSPPHRTPDLPLAPRRAFFRTRVGSVLKTSLRPAWLSFRKPWN